MNSEPKRIWIGLLCGSVVATAQDRWHDKMGSIVMMASTSSPSTGMLDPRRGCRASTMAAGVIAILLLWTSAAAAETKPRITQVETAGNPAAVGPVGCVPLATLTHRHTPADLMPGVRACIEAGDPRGATELYALFGVYGRFDTLRVADKSAHQTVTVLRMVHLAPVDPELMKSFRVEFQRYLHRGSPELAELCTRLQALGRPTYRPDYMLRHGMSAFTGRGGGLRADFDPEAAWREALDGYLHCPG